MMEILKSENEELFEKFPELKEVRDKEIVTEKKE